MNNRLKEFELNDEGLEMVSGGVLDDEALDWLNRNDDDIIELLYTQTDITKSTALMNQLKMSSHKYTVKELINKMKEEYGIDLSHLK